VKRRRILARGATAALVFLVLGTLLGPLAATAGAGTGPRGLDRNRRIAVGDVFVEAGEKVDGPLIAIDGRATISGTVDDSAFVIKGDVRVHDGGFVDGDVFVVKGDAVIAGKVDGDVVVLRGRAVIRDGALVTGDVSSTETPRVEKGARVRGDVKDINLGSILRAFGISLLLFWWVAVTASTLALGAVMVGVFQRAMEGAADVGRSRAWWHALLAGLGVIVGMPIAAFLAFGTVVGIPLGLGLLGVMGFVHAIGYVTGAFFLGRSILKPPRSLWSAFFLGWGILRVLAILPGIGVLVWVAAAVYGIGALSVVAVRAGHLPRGTTGAPDAGPPPEPTEPTVEATSA
jgi:cytoskeletal protein CcmA (bactofilin family)